MAHVNQLTEKGAMNPVTNDSAVAANRMHPMSHDHMVPTTGHHATSGHHINPLNTQINPVMNHPVVKPVSHDMVRLNFCHHFI